MARELKIDFHPYGEPSPRLDEGNVQFVSFFDIRISDLVLILKIM